MGTTTKAQFGWANFVLILYKEEFYLCFLLKGLLLGFDLLREGGF